MAVECRSRHSEVVMLGSAERNNRYSRRDDVHIDAEEEPLPEMWEPKELVGRLEC